MADLQGSSTDGASSRSYLAALRQYLWVPLLCVVVAAAAGYLFADQMARSYTGRALLKVNDENLTRTLLGLERGGAQDAAELAVALIPQIDQNRTAERTLAVLGGDGRGLTVAEIQDHTDVELDRENGLVAVTAERSSPAGAARLANAYAGAYVYLRDRSDRAQIAAAIRGLESQLSRLRRSASENPVDVQSASQLSATLQSMRLFRQTHPQTVSVAKAATTPSQPSGISARLAALLAGAFGLLVGLGLVAVRAQIDTRIHDPSDLEALFGAPSLTHVPESRRLRRRSALARLKPGDVEPFRVLLARLSRDGRQRSQTLLITSALAGEGKSTAAWYLASVSAISGSRTLLLELDRARPSCLTAELYGDGSGLAEVIAKERSASDVTRQVDAGDGHRFDVIPFGRGDGTVHLSQGESVDALLGWSEWNYDLVIIEAPPLSATADAIPFARRAAMIAVVCRHGKATPKNCLRLRALVEGLDAEITGIITVGFDVPTYY